MSTQGQAAPSSALQLPGECRLAIVVARFNAAITDKLLEGVYNGLAAVQGSASQIDVVPVPGAFELPLAARTLAHSGRYAAVVCLGCVIRGETDHYDYVCTAAMEGILRAGLDTGIPVIFGVLTTDNLEQAQDRSGGKDGNKGQDALLAAVEMIDVLRRIG